MVHRWSTGIAFPGIEGGIRPSGSVGSTPHPLTTEGIRPAVGLRPWRLGQPSERQGDRRQLARPPAAASRTSAGPAPRTGPAGHPRTGWLAPHGSDQRGITAARRSACAHRSSGCRGRRGCRVGLYEAASINVPITSPAHHRLAHHHPARRCRSRCRPARCRPARRCRSRRCPGRHTRRGNRDPVGATRGAASVG